MIRIILCGCNGAMGKKIVAQAEKRQECKIVAGIDLNSNSDYDFPVFTDINKCTVDADALIDFSHPSALENSLILAKSKNIPAVIATTGLSDEQVERIKETSKAIPIFYTGNYSIGINLLVDLVKKASALLCNDFDVEIVEAHHNQKIDAPSGTANMLFKAVQDGCCGDRYAQYDRHSVRKKRDPKEIGMHSLRGGTIVGEHQVIFAGQDEVVTISHSARSKDVFAVGSLNAANFIVNKGPGLYDMTDLIND